MGIFLYLKISKSVTETEWATVYQETLELAKKLDLADLQTLETHGVKVRCLTKVDERDEGELSGHWIGWGADGDYSHMGVSEFFGIPKYLRNVHKPEMDAGDALLGALEFRHEKTADRELFQHTYGMWGRKTGHELYHTRLLAIAALIESRLGSKAFTYGDIEPEEFDTAVYLANLFVKEQVKLPSSCVLDLFYQRIVNLPVSIEEQVYVLDTYYYGDKNAEEFARCRECVAHGIPYVSQQVQNQPIENETTASQEKVEEDSNCKHGKEYDITRFRTLKYYKTGNTIDPYLIDRIKEVKSELEPLKKDQKLEELRHLNPQRQCEWIARESMREWILIRDIDWMNTFKKIDNNPEAVDRYYMLIKGYQNNWFNHDIILAIWTNDDFFRFVMQLN